MNAAKTALISTIMSGTCKNIAYLLYYFVVPPTESSTVRDFASTAYALLTVYVGTWQE